MLNENDVYNCIIRYKICHDGNTPTLLELAGDLGLSGPSAAKYWVDKLIESGLLLKIDKKICVAGGRYVAPNK